MCSSRARMFGAIKRIFNKTPTPDAEKAPPSPAFKPAKAAPNLPPGPPPRAYQPPAADSSGNNVVLSLARIVELLPKDLQSGVTPSSVQGLTFAIAREQILPQ